MSTTGEIIYNQIKELKYYSKPKTLEKYYNIKDLLQIQIYNKGCNKNIKTMIKKKEWKDVLFGRIGIDDQTIIVTEKYSPKYCNYFVNIEEVNKEFYIYETNSNIIDNEIEKHENKDFNVEPIPELIEQNKYCFFKDKDNKTHNVEMRGNRNKEDIFFKLSDISSLFEQPNLHKLVTDNREYYLINHDYKFFIHEKNGDAGKLMSKELYITFNGLQKIIRNSNHSKCKEFLSYLDEIVFATIAGNQEQRIKASAEILQVDLEAMKNILGRYAGNMSCIYVLNTGLKSGDDDIYKFGHTKNLDKRFKEHIRTFGNNLKLESFCFIPEDKRTEAEVELKESLSFFNKKLEINGFEKQSELLFLNQQSKKIVKSILTTINDKYGNESKQISIKLENEIKNLMNTIESNQRNYQHQLLLKNKDIELLKQDCKFKLELKDKDLELKDHKIELKDKDLEIIKMKNTILQLQLDKFTQ